MATFRFNSVRARFEGLDYGSETQRIWDAAARREDPTIILPKLPLLPARHSMPEKPRSASEAFRVTLQQGLAHAAFNDAFDELFPGIAEQLPDNPRAAFVLGLEHAMPEQPTKTSLPSEDSMV